MLLFQYYFPVFFSCLCLCLGIVDMYKVTTLIILLAFLSFYQFSAAFKQYFSNFRIKTMIAFNSEKFSFTSLQGALGMKHTISLFLSPFSKSYALRMSKNSCPKSHTDLCLILKLVLLSFHLLKHWVCARVVVCVSVCVHELEHKNMKYMNYFHLLETLGYAKKFT